MASPLQASWDKTEALFLELLASPTLQLSAKARDAALDYIDHNEFGLAFEMLTDDFDQNDWPIADHDLSLVRHLAERMNMALQR